MKRKLYMLLLIPLLLLSGCKSTRKAEIDFAFNIVKDNDLCLTFSVKHPEYSFYDDSKTVYLTMVNANPKAIEFKVDEVKMLRDKDGAEYSTYNILKYGIKLECDVKKTSAFNFELPTSYKDDHYTFYLKYSDVQIIYHLYIKSSNGNSGTRNTSPTLY